MRRYANKTSVSEGKSRGEIEEILRRFGADQFAYATDEEKRATAIQFRYHGLMVRMAMALPDAEDLGIQQTPKGRRRKPSVIQVEYDRERRRLWRALALAIKAKLVAVEEGITTFEVEWLPYVLWADGRTTAEHLIPAIVAGAKLPPMPRALLTAKPTKVKKSPLVGEIVQGEEGGA